MREYTLTYFGFVQCPLQSLDFFTVFATQCGDVFSKLNTKKDAKKKLSSLLRLISERSKWKLLFACAITPVSVVTKILVESYAELEICAKMLRL